MTTSTKATSSKATSTKTPNAKTTNIKKSSKIVLWVVGIVALAWNGMLGLNLFEQMDPAATATLPDDYQVFFANRPQWVLPSFAIAIVTGLLGAVALLMRWKLSIWAFRISCLAAIIVLVPTIASGPITIAIGSSITVILAGFFAWYVARTLK